MFTTAAAVGRKNAKMAARVIDVNVLTSLGNPEDKMTAYYGRLNPTVATSFGWAMIWASHVSNGSPGADFHIINGPPENPAVYVGVPIDPRLPTEATTWVTVGSQGDGATPSGLRRIARLVVDVAVLLSTLVDDGYLPPYRRFSLANAEVLRRVMTYVVRRMDDPCLITLGRRVWPKVCSDGRLTLSEIAEGVDAGQSHGPGGANRNRLMHGAYYGPLIQAQYSVSVDATEPYLRADERFALDLIVQAHGEDVEFTRYLEPTMPRADALLDQAEDVLCFLQVDRTNCRLPQAADTVHAYVQYGKKLKETRAQLQVSMFSDASAPLQSGSTALPSDFADVRSNNTSVAQGSPTSFSAAGVSRDETMMHHDPSGMGEEETSTAAESAADSPLAPRGAAGGVGFDEPLAPVPAGPEVPVNPAAQAMAAAARLSVDEAQRLVIDYHIANAEAVEQAFLTLMRPGHLAYGAEHQSSARSEAPGSSADRGQDPRPEVRLVHINWTPSATPAGNAAVKADKEKDKDKSKSMTLSVPRQVYSLTLTIAKLRVAGSLRDDYILTGHPALRYPAVFMYAGLDDYAESTKPGHEAMMSAACVRCYQTLAGGAIADYDRVHGLDFQEPLQDRRDVSLFREGIAPPNLVAFAIVDRTCDVEAAPKCYVTDSVYGGGSVMGQMPNPTPLSLEPMDAAGSEERARREAEFLYSRDVVASVFNRFLWRGIEELCQDTVEGIFETNAFLFHFSRARIDPPNNAKATKASPDMVYYSFVSDANAERPHARESTLAPQRYVELFCLYSIEGPAKDLSVLNQSTKHIAKHFYNRAKASEQPPR
jgi:hypothetical protein